MSDTFSIDNFALQNTPTFLAAKRGEIQMDLPGMEPPFSVFEIWVLWGCYYHLNPDDPTAEFTVTKTELLRVL